MEERKRGREGERERVGGGRRKKGGKRGESILQETEKTMNDLLDNIIRPRHTLFFYIPPALLLGW